MSNIEFEFRWVSSTTRNLISWAKLTLPYYLFGTITYGLFVQWCAVVVKELMTKVLVARTTHATDIVQSIGSGFSALRS
jgi:hypothetical protein